MNECGFRPPLGTYRLNWARRTTWGWWDECPTDRGFEIRAMKVWGRARCLSVTEALHNTEFYEWMEKKHVCFFQTAETGKRTPSSSVKGSGANHYVHRVAVNKGRWTNAGWRLGHSMRRRPSITPTLVESFLYSWPGYRIVWQDLYLSTFLFEKPSR